MTESKNEKIIEIERGFKEIELELESIKQQLTKIKKGIEEYIYQAQKLIDSKKIEEIRKKLGLK